ncbi:MAG: DUF975 family protein, partial [Oscillospiraceae bacterium]|nr:DUF975 family protein [Oscillospiraceae bacterium]
DKVLQDLIEDNIAAGRIKAAEQLEEYQNSEMTNSVVGRNNGIFAAIANTISSGQLYILIFSGIHSITHSTRIASAIVVFFTLLLFVLFWIFIRNTYSAVLRRAFLESRLYETFPVAHFMHLKLVHRWIRASLTMLLKTVLLTLWSLTIVGGVIKYFSYFLVSYIVAENPDIKPMEAITLSRRMMDGHKMECFKMELSFIGWYLLGIITFSVSDVVWALPYRVATHTEFYTEVRAEAIEKNIENAELLNDKYLYEYAEESLLRQTYKDIEEQKRFIDENRVTLPPVRAFIAKNFGLWVGSLEEKKMYDEVDNRRQQIVNDRAVIKWKIYPQRLNPLWDDKNNLIVKGIRSIRTYTLWSIVLIFFSFCFVGWIWEVGLHLVADGVFVNRGVMHGPWLPIYGGGVVMIIVLLARWRNKPLTEVVLIVLLCGALEYFSSLILELTKGMRWWDYTGYFLNLNGRICGEGLLVFALGGMAAVYLLVPALDTMWSKVKPRIISAICVVLLLLFSADLVYSSFVPNTGEGITDYTAYEEIQTGQNSIE